MKVLCLVIVNVTKYMHRKVKYDNLWLSGVFFQAPNTPKTRFRHPAEGAYDAPPDLLVGWGEGHPRWGGGRRPECRPQSVVLGWNADYTRRQQESN